MEFGREINLKKSYQNIVVMDGELYINGEKVPRPKGNKRKTNIVQSGRKIFVNGYEWKHNKWKRTFWSIVNGFM